MRSKKLPAAMREKVKDYFYLQFSNGKLHKEDEIFDFLSPVLRRQIKEFTGRDICRKVPLLSTPSSKDFAQDIACVIEPTIVFANEVIMREQTTGDEMFFICSGVVEIYLSSANRSSYLAIGDGCVSMESKILIELHSFFCPDPKNAIPPSRINNWRSILETYHSCWACDVRHRQEQRLNACSIVCERAASLHCCVTIQKSRQK